ncbi:MAG: hypothetical protein D6815_09965 [Candidatus Dadabacteria bacterium]|nr:MAG: hypothetical protein D6815_09965 [Candidatus Dadabacteria bacterium]
MARAAIFAGVTALLAGVFLTATETLACESPLHTFNVNSTVDGGDAAPGDGVCSDPSGLCTLRAALEEANTVLGCDLVSVPAGTYVAVGLRITDPVVLRGAGADQTIIDAQHFGYPDYCFDLGLMAQLVNGPADTSGLPPECFTTPSGLGQAVWVVYANQGAATLNIDTDGQVVVEDLALVRGGNAVRVHRADLAILRGVNISDNWGWPAGAIYTRSPLLVDRAILSGNFSMNVGAAIGCSSESDSVPSVILSDSVIENNVVGNLGSGISCNGPVTVSDTLFRNNITPMRGGAAAFGSDEGSARVTIVRSAFIDNEGGGLSARGSLRVSDSTFSGNTTQGGGSAITLTGGSAQLERVTITNNHNPCAADPNCYTTAQGGAVVGAHVKLSSSILSGNDPLDCEGNLKLQGANLIGEASACALSGDVDQAMLGVDPLLGPLGLNGGTTPSHAPLPGSPAIDAGGQCRGADQRGLPRPQGPACDLGSIEVVACDFDGALDPGEGCDDGNAVSGDGCSDLCEPELVAGQSILLSAQPGRSDKSKLRVTLRDAAIEIGHGNGSEDDPVLHGATVRLVSASGNGFDRTLALPASGWRYLGKPGENRGYAYKDRGGVIRSVKVQRKRMIKIAGQGGALALPLDVNPAPVAVELVLGTRSFAAAFGGQIKFRDGRRFLAKDAPPPSAMPGG